MKSNQKIGRITGVLLLFVFISGITIFQVLQGAVLFSEDFITITSENSNKIISSTLLGIINGIVSIVIATILLPIFKRHSSNLAYLYIAFCILNFIAIMIDNMSVVSMLELSNEYVKNGNDSSLKILETFVYQKHRWTHYFYLLISCFPVFILYYTLYLYKLVPRILSIFGIFAVLIMFIEELLSIFGHGISMNMLLPMALIQLTLPLWLIFKGFNQSVLETKMK
ncbi:DUF4386 domain-containing protein [Cellulophaga sp. L1A9]|uniref:DUF4386 domain-containing protein n=1 Tax=Cellulophaga sp. L1A9 TaxID=2686362 RepID=UPI00131B871F|nr:DUF4386 domain-containing protein [Cellulophaga sp. L1A9]